MKMTKEMILLEFLFPQYTKREIITSRFISYFLCEQNPIKSYYKISPEKIIKSEDKRTTIIIQNIPEEMDKDTLIKILENTGNINYVYLPFDKLKNRNLGYAFINMVNYKNIINLYKKFNGIFLKGYYIKLPLLISYSQIQGKEKMSQFFFKKDDKNY